MSKSSVNEWDASDASDDEDGLKTPKTPGSAVSSPEAQSPKYSIVSPSYNPTSPTAYMSSEEESPPYGGAESPKYSNVSPSYNPTSPTAYMRSEEESPRVESQKYSDVSPFRPTSPTAYMNSKEDRAYEARREMAERIQAKMEQDRRKTPAALTKRDAEHAKLLPLFASAGLKIPKVDDKNWRSHNRSLNEQIDEDQQKIYQMEAKLRLKKNAHGAAESFYYSHHA